MAEFGSLLDLIFSALISPPSLPEMPTALAPAEVIAQL